MTWTGLNLYCDPARRLLVLRLVSMEKEHGGIFIGDLGKVFAGCWRA